MHCEIVGGGCGLKNTPDFLFVEVSFWRLFGSRKLTVSTFSLLFYCQSVPWGILKILQSKDSERLLQSIYCIDTLPRHADRMSSLHVVLKKEEEKTTIIYLKQEYFVLEQTKAIIY